MTWTNISREFLVIIQITLSMVVLHHHYENKILRLTTTHTIEWKIKKTWDKCSASACFIGIEIVTFSSLYFITDSFRNSSTWIKLEQFRDKVTRMTTSIRSEAVDVIRKVYGNRKLEKDKQGNKKLWMDKQTKWQRRCSRILYIHIHLCHL